MTLLTLPLEASAALVSSVCVLSVDLPHRVRLRTLNPINNNNLIGFNAQIDESMELGTAERILRAGVELLSLRGDLGSN